MLGVQEFQTRLFRNQVGKAYVGKVERFSKATDVQVFPGDLVIRNARTVTTGMCPGSSDLIGWTSKTCTPEMLGTKIAVFTAIEAKVPGGKVAAEQRHFVDTVQKAGGIAAISTSSLEAQDAVCLFRGSGIRG